MLGSRVFPGPCLSLALSCFLTSPGPEEPFASPVPSLKEVLFETVDLAGDQGLFEGKSLEGELELLFLEDLEEDSENFSFLGERGA